MIVGEKSKFAIEWVIQSSELPIGKVGRFCFWINGERVGDWKELTYPEYQVRRMKPSLRRDNDDGNLCDLAAVDALWNVWLHMYGDNEVTSSVDFHSYIISSGEDSFEHGAWVIRVPCNRYDRIIWWQTTGEERVTRKPDGDGWLNQRPVIVKSGEILLEKGSYRAIVNEAERSLGMQISATD